MITVDPYGTAPSDFKRGDRVQLHPSTDLYMQGKRYGTVVTVGKKVVSVEIDRGQLTNFSKKGPMVKCAPWQLAVLRRTPTPAKDAHHVM
jgi:hypothetical protein